MGSHKHTLKITLPFWSLLNKVITSSTPLIASRTRCFPSVLKNEHSTPSLSTSKRDFPCRGASQGDQRRTKANHLTLSANLSFTFLNSSHGKTIYGTHLVNLPSPQGRPNLISLNVDFSPSAASIGASTAQRVVPGD